MFKKLVSNIPFNPSLIERIPEYSASLRRDFKIRVLGLVILVVAFLAQIFISIMPAQPSINSSPNDLIRGGFSNKADLMADCYSNYKDYRNILAYYGINCNSIASTTNTYIKSSDYSGQVYSLNRVGYGLANEDSVYIHGNTYWTRPISESSSLQSISYKALSGTTSYNTKYFVLYDSANLLLIGRPTASTSCSLGAAPQCPQQSISARDNSGNNVAGKNLQPNSVITYSLTTSNTTSKPLNNYVVSTNISSALSYAVVQNTYDGVYSNGVVSWLIKSLPVNQSVTENLALSIKSPVTNSPLSSTDGNFNNIKMTVNYGNSITVKLPISFSKFIELRINNALPSASILISIVLTSLLTIYTSYFALRDWIILKELKKLRQDYLDGGKN